MEDSMTIIRYRASPESPEITLESPRAPGEAIDYIRQKFFGDLPARDEAFEKAVAIQKNSGKQQQKTPGRF